MLDLTIYLIYGIFVISSRYDFNQSFTWWTDQMRKGNLVVRRNLPDDAPLEAENLYLREEANLKYRHEGIIGKSREIKKVQSNKTSSITLP